MDAEKLFIGSCSMSVQTKSDGGGKRFILSCSHKLACHPSLQSSVKRSPRRALFLTVSLLIKGNFQNECVFLPFILQFKRSANVTRYSGYKRKTDREGKGGEGIHIHSCSVLAANHNSDGHDWEAPLRGNETESVQGGDGECEEREREGGGYLGMGGGEGNTETDWEWRYESSIFFSLSRWIIVFQETFGHWGLLNIGAR